MIIDYKVIEARNVDDLSRLVLQSMERGWIPHGPFTAIALYDGPYFYQPMVHDGSR